MKKIVYVSDTKKEAISSRSLEKTIPFKKLGLEEIALIQNSPSDILQKVLANHDIRSNVIETQKLSPSKILKIANEQTASLIIIDLDTLNGSRNSIIKKLIKKSTIPILFIVDNEQTEKTDDNGWFSSVIFSTNWSSESQKALNFLFKLKNILGIVEIINVINHKLTIKDLRELKERIAKTRKVCLDEKIDTEAHIYAGNTSSEILLAAKDYKSTIIIMGGSQKKKNLINILKKKFRGSASYKVTEEATLPVLVIP